MKRIRFLFFLSPLLAASPTYASDWSGWWLPTNYARHGVAVDRLFGCIFWITIGAFALVHVALVLFLIRYRRRAGSARTQFVKGSVRLELIWTAIPTVILASLAVESAKVWDNYRYSADGSHAANILVIGQQFKWNIIYPGKDGKFGRYLIYPKPTDSAWPHSPKDMQHYFVGVPGPASLPYKQDVQAINQFISQNDTVYQLGKDLSDSDGIDDDVEDALGRTLYLPVNRETHIEVLSRDVIHDLFLPNFRVQLYAVPGMVASFTITPTQTTAEMEAQSHRLYTLYELATLLNAGEYRLTSDDSILSPAVLLKLKAAGVTTVNAYRPAHLEALCAQLCGTGHATMKTDIVVLSQEEYHRRFE